MSLIRRYLTGFRGVDTLEPGLFEKDDGTSWYRKPDGSEIEIGNGGSMPYEWANIALNDNGAVLTVASNEWDANILTDLTIVQQSDAGIFSLDPTLGLISSEDGWYTLGCYCTPTGNTFTPDGVSSEQRWLWILAGMGGSFPFLSTGFDTLIPVGGLATRGATALGGVASPYHADPDFTESLLAYIGVQLIGTGTDSLSHPAGVINTGAGGNLLVYKVAPLA